MCSHIRSKYGFTLIELMVVMTIIAILVGLLYPSLKSARDKALQEQCASNLRKIAAGLHLYAKDHGGAFPVNGALGSWGDQLWDGGYVTDEKVFDCPAHVFDITDPSIKGNHTTPDYWWGNTAADAGSDFPLSIYSPEWRMIIMCYDAPHSGGQNIVNVAGKVYFEIW